MAIHGGAIVWFPEGTAAAVPGRLYSEQRGIPLSVDQKAVCASNIRRKTDKINNEGESTEEGCDRKRAENDRESKEKKEEEAFEPIETRANERKTKQSTRRYNAGSQNHIS